MIYQISSGQGPDECELGVAKFLSYLQRHYSITVLDTSKGYHAGTFRSVRLSSDDDLSEYIGSVQWICQSRYRPGHKRKNWFMDFRECPAAEPIKFNRNDVLIETFHCGGNGGQNVNKTETGVRAVFTPTGAVATCTEERSQFQNKQKALKRLENIVNRQNREIRDENTKNIRKRHTAIVRGNAAVRFRGGGFIPERSSAV